MENHIKIHGITPRIQYVANGENTTFEFPFAIFKNENLEVYIGETLQNSNTYTISGAGNTDGGSVTFSSAPAAGSIITLFRNLSIERTTDFQEGGALRANALNYELDYQTACQQQIADNMNRAMTFPPYAMNTDIDLTLPTPSAGKAIVWNSEGTNLENSTVEVNALESTLRGYKTAAETAANTATTKANLATTKASVATEQAGIATAKAEEAEASVSLKANRGMDNLYNSGKRAVANLAFPSSSYVNLEFPEAGTNASYTAPKNGYFNLRVRTSTVGSSIMLANSSGGRVVCYAPNVNLQCGVMMPVRSGDTVTAYVYDYSSNSSSNIFRFVYAQGEV